MSRSVVLMVSACVLSAVLWIATLDAAVAAGGTNGLLGRMETMVSQMETSGEMTASEARQTRLEIKRLRATVEARIETNGGWINPKHDQDLYAEIDRYNKPLFDRYQRSKAKQTAPRGSLGYKPDPVKQ